MNNYKSIDDTIDNRESFKVQSLYNLMTKTDEEIIRDIGCAKSSDEEVAIENINNENHSDSRKTIYERLFSKMEAGSLRGSIFAMSSIALGTGCLALPLVLNELSLVFGSTLIILGAVAAYWSLVIMIEASKKTNSSEYSNLVLNSLGPCPALLLDIAVLLYIFGVLISYQVLAYQLIGSFVYEVAYTKKYATQHEFEDKFWYEGYIRFFVMFGTCLLLIPMCLLKDISKMRMASLFSIMSVLYSIIVIVIECPWYYSDFVATKYDPNDPKKQVNWYDFSKAFGDKLYFFRGTATIFFAYTCHSGAFPVYKTLKNNVQRRINKVFQRSIAIDFGIYIMVGICGYLTQPILTPAIIINRNKLLSNDLAMVIAKFLMALNLILSTPANYNGFRLSFLSIFCKSTEVTNKRNLLVTIPALLVSCLIGSFYYKITSIISILGGFISVVIAFLFPGLLYVKNSDHPITHYKNIFTLILITILCLIGFTAGFLTIFYPI